MANTARITVTVDDAAGNLSDAFIHSNPIQAANTMQNFIGSAVSGSRAASLNVLIGTGNATAATGTITLTSVVSGDSVEINGIAFTAGTDFTVGGTDTISATNLKNAINASANTKISGIVTASSALGVVTITSANYGYVGNLITLEGKGNHSIDPDGSGVGASSTLTCASTAANDTAVINGTTLTAVDKKEKTQITAVADTGVKETTDLTAVADTGVKEVTTVTLVADVAGSLNSTYFTFKAKNTGGATETGYYVWYNINSAGVDPAVAAHTAIPVTGATGATANTLATATRAAITSVAGSKVTVTGATNQAIITGNYMGNATNAADGAAATGFTIATSPGGAASNLNSSYFTYVTRASGGATTSSRYVWYNVNGEGVDPAPGGTGIVVALSAAATNSTVASSTRTALAADTNVTITGATTHIIITNNYMGTATDTADGAAATGFAISRTANGAASNLLNSFFTFYSAADATKYGIWYNVNSEGVAPTITGVSSGNRVAVAIAASDTASTIAAATRAVFLSSPLTTDFAESGATDKVVIRNTAVGTTTDAADGSTATGFTFTNQVQGGTVSAVQFQIGASNSADATSLAALINAQTTTLVPIVTATAASAVVTVTAIKDGVEGNDITLSATGGISAGAARLAGGTNYAVVRLSGGVNDTGSTTYSFGR